MAHPEDCCIDAERRAGREHLIEKRDEDGEAFEREALGAEVAGLNDLLEDVGADEVGKDVRLAGSGRRLLHLRLQPLALCGVDDMHELDADAAAVDGAGLGRELAFGRGRGEWLGRQVLAERVERSLQVAPAAEDVEDGIAQFWHFGGGVLLGGGDGGHGCSSD